MKTSPIKSFLVYGLFGTSDVHIPFENDVKILIGENGLGKTQVLNMFYYVLTGNFLKLRECSFEKIEIEFENERIGISKNDLVFENDDNAHVTRKIFSKLGLRGISLHEFKLRVNLETNHKKKKEIIEDIIIKHSQLSNRKNSVYENYLFNYFLENEKSISKQQKTIYLNNLKNFEKKIKQNLSNEKVLYFPTYRRVEEDLKNLGYNEEEFHSNDDKLIQFGMDDVKARFNTIENNIDNLLKEGFSKISGEILSQLVKGFSDADSSILNRIDENDIEIILARVGQQLSEKDKNEIRNIVLNQKINNQSLLFFLQKLIEIYEKQRPLDNLVKKYKSICNKYLINKEVFYDESDIRIYIKSKLSDEEISLEKLSSGEKQILAIFSKIYLSKKDQRFIVLFDEPELSLSMKWQQQLLPDMVDSGKCDFLLAVTHSPFIFDNKLDQYAMGLNEYFTLSNNELIIA